jgi:hypothetical protein
MAVAIG